MTSWRLILIAAAILALAILGTAGLELLTTRSMQPSPVTLTPPAIAVPSPERPIKEPPAEKERVEYINTHAHPFWGPSDGPLQAVYDGVAKTALQAMNSSRTRKTLFMPPPFSPDMRDRFDWKELVELKKRSPERFGFLAGGGVLNVMIHSTPPGAATADVQGRFEAAAREIISSGAVGFGEIAVEHFSLHIGHPYESVPPDHPLLLLLADIAASHGLPMDLHMEAIPHNMPLPEKLSSPPNPRGLRENMAAFERLLSHNRDARIVWAHAGWDNTGQRTVTLMRQLLERHSNLYMSIKIQKATYPENTPLDQRGGIRPEWVEMMRSFPDRFMIGSDPFYGVAGEVRWRTEPGGFQDKEDPIRVFLRQLPDDLSLNVAHENAAKIYRLRQ